MWMWEIGSSTTKPLSTDEVAKPKESRRPKRGGECATVAKGGSAGESFESPFSSQ